MREIRTKPGDLFKRSDIIRTQRELATLDYFNPETLGNIDIQPDPVRNTVDITYNVEEKSSDKIQLQGGWGAGRVIGTLMFEFKNFSTRNFFKPRYWDPLHRDGQRVIVSLLLMEYIIKTIEYLLLPWLGGKNQLHKCIFI